MTLKRRFAVGNLSKFSILVPVVGGLNAGENWLLRGIAGALFLLIGLCVVFFPMLLSRQFAFATDTTRFAREHRKKSRLAVEVSFRLLWLGVIIFMVPLFFCMCLDFYDFARRGYPVTIQATVRGETNSGLMWWAWKDLDLQMADGRTDTYNLFFHPRFSEKGGSYEIVILPKSKTVLSLKPQWR